MSCEPYAVTNNTLLPDGYRATFAASPESESRGDTSLADPGAVSHQPAMTEPATTVATNTSQEMVSIGSAHHKRRTDALDPAADTLADEGGGGGSSDMTTPIVALSTADVTVRSILICLFSAIAVVVAGGKIDFASLRRGSRRPRPVYLRVDQRPTVAYQQPDLRRRVLSSGALVLLAVVGGIVIAITVSIMLATAVSSVTNLLR